MDMHKYLYILGNKQFIEKKYNNYKNTSKKYLPYKGELAPKARRILQL